MTLHAVVPAAGVGRRMGADRPKQYLALQGRLVIDWSIAAVAQAPGLQRIVVALGQDDPYWPETESSSLAMVKTVPGGAERADSVLNALRALSATANDSDWVLVHDAARPCLRQDDLLKLIEQGRVGQGAVLGAPVHDTMKRAMADGCIDHTVERHNLWAAFTPQMFRLGDLREALHAALQAGINITDEASAMEWAGLRPCLVQGHPGNIKITRPGDLELAAFHLRPASGR